MYLRKWIFAAMFLLSSLTGFAVQTSGNVLITNPNLKEKVATWVDINGSVYTVMASKYTLLGGWSSPTAISSGPYPFFIYSMPSGSMNDLGDAVITWEATDTSTGNVIVCAACGNVTLEGWSAIQVLSDPSSEYAGYADQKAVIETDRSIYVTWTSSIGSDTYIRGIDGTYISESSIIWGSPFNVSN